MDYEFPFDVPEDVSTLNRKQTDELFALVKAHGLELAADENASVEAIDATHELFSTLKERRASFAAAAKKAAEFGAADDDDAADDDGDGDDDADDTDDTDDTDGDAD